MASERIYTETPLQSLWDRIDLLSTIDGAKHLIEQNAINSKVKLDIRTSLMKAEGVTFCVRSAFDFFHKADSHFLTPDLVNLYYGTYNLLSAIVIANPKNKITLEQIEQISKNGHGLKAAYVDGQKDIGNNEFVYISQNGFFPNYLSNNYDHIDLTKIACAQNINDPSRVKPEDQHKLISFKDLISRIPELFNLYIELFQEHPKYINYRFNNTHLKADSAELEVPIVYNSQYLNSSSIIDIIDLDIKDLYFEKRLVNQFHDQYSFFPTKYVSRDLLPSEPPYHSPLSMNCFIKPLNGIEDVLEYYFILLYMLSIWTRYRPNLWRRINEGDIDIYRSLIKNLVKVARRIIPNLFLNKMYNRKIVLASHSYWG